MGRKSMEQSENKQQDDNPARVVNPSGANPGRRRNLGPGCKQIPQTLRSKAEMEPTRAQCPAPHVSQIQGLPLRQLHPTEEPLTGCLPNK